MQISLFDGATKFKIDKPIRLIELFGGIGSQAQALKNIGADFEHYRMCELDKYAVTSYNAVHGTNFYPSDITKLKGADLGIINTDKFTYLLTYSFPCQDLSSAGKGAGMEKGSGTRSGLLWEVERLLTETKELPQILLLENVPEIVGKKNIQHFAKWQEKLESFGYKNKWEVLNAKDFGIPQNRERCFMVSVLGDYFYDFPKPEKSSIKPIELIDLKVPKKYYVSEKTKNAIENTLVRYSYLLSDKQIPTVVLYDDYNNKIKTDQSAIGCLTTNSGARAVRNGQKIVINGWVRVLTPGECWRFMGFKDEYFLLAKKALNNTYFKGKDRADSQLYKQAGNSIVVQVLEAVFKQMI